MKNKQFDQIKFGVPGEKRWKKFRPNQLKFGLSKKEAKISDQLKYSAIRTTARNSGRLNFDVQRKWKIQTNLKVLAERGFKKIKRNFKKKMYFYWQVLMHDTFTPITEI